MTLPTVRKNTLLATSVVVYLVTLLMLLSELDRQYYQVEKESIIKYNFRELFPHETRELQAASSKILVQHAAEGGIDKQLEGEWRALTQSMLEGEGCVFRIRIVPKDEEQLLVERDDEKFRRLNGFANTLFYRNFENVVSYEIADAAGVPWIGLLSFHYATPEDYAPIVSLTNRYRLWALLIVAGVTAAYAFVLRRLILPTRRVVSRIDAATTSPPKLMSKPYSLLERAYNDLARDAILLRIGQTIRNLAAENPTFTRADVLSHVPRLLVELLDCEAALVCELLADDTGHVALSGCVAADDGAGRRDYEAYCRTNVFTPENVQKLADAPRQVFGECVVCDISRAEDERHRSCLVVFLPLATRHPTLDTRNWHLETVDRLARQLRDILVAFDLQRRHIRNERSRANINLARNLGHDLTNIIATSKLDIRTIVKVLDGMDEGDGEATGKQRLLLDAANGLLDSTRLLQEVVNIYRSFSYINRPKFETVSAGTVLDEIIDVFSLSLPAGIVVRRDYADGLLACTIEPRLIKLAVFNVLTNAVDAIKQNPDPARGEGVITVSTRTDTDGDGVCIAIRDNGPGIRNDEGNTATQAEIDRVFRYGVSSKTEEGGEGLGLNWVWTIVEEFHSGRAEARNCPDGGAEFCLWIPSERRGDDDGTAHQNPDR